MSLLNVVVFSAELTFLLPASADKIHDVPLVPAPVVIFNGVPVVVGLPACWLHYLCKNSCFFWHPWCIGCPVVAFTPAVACIPAVVSNHDIAVILAVTVAGVTVVACVTAVDCICGRLVYFSS